MPAGIGYGMNFMPPATPSPSGQRGAPGLGPSEAPVQTLRMNLPKVAGARALAAPGVLAPQAGASSPESAVLNSMLSTFARPDMGPAVSGGLPQMGGGAMPSMGGGPMGGNPDDELRRLVEQILQAIGSPQPGPNVIPGAGGGPEIPSPTPGPPEPPISVPEEPPTRNPIERSQPQAPWQNGADLLRSLGF